MKFNFGLFSITFNWNVENESIVGIDTIRRVDLPKTICSTSYGGFYVGEVNGHAIILSGNDGQTTGDWYYAFKFARKYRSSGCRDWVVPNPDELKAIHQYFAPDTTKFELFQLDKQFAFRTIPYWTDRESNISFSHTLHFGRHTLITSTSQKVNTEGVRLIRRMKIIED